MYHILTQYSQSTFKCYNYLCSLFSLRVSIVLPVEGNNNALFKILGITTFGLPSNIYLDLLMNILEFQSTTDRVQFLDPVDLKTYVGERRTIPDSKSERCDVNMKWCTFSAEEKQKCQWLAQAALNRGIQPVVACVESSDQLECIDDVQNKKADLLTIDANYGFVAKRKNLAAVAFPETAVSDLLYVFIVIKNDSSIERLENLRGKSACLPEYGGIGG